MNGGLVACLDIQTLNITFWKRFDDENADQRIHNNIESDYGNWALGNVLLS